MIWTDTFRLGICATVMVSFLIVGAKAQDAIRFTSKFPVDDCHFSTFGGQPYFILNPGHRLVLKGMEDGEDKVLTITPLNETKEIKLLSAGKTRTIATRVVEERGTINGKLSEISRSWYARCVETGDVYYFGAELDSFENGVLANRSRVWESGVDGALPGMVMPRTFLLGARYVQAQTPWFALDQSENIAMGLTMATPAGSFEDCVQIREHDGVKPELGPSVKTYAPGVGLVNDDDIFKLEEFHLGTEGLPRGAAFVPFSNHPFFPFAPGQKLVLEGTKDGKRIVRTSTVLDEIREIRLRIGGEETLIPARVIEEREAVDGRLIEVSRKFFAQCVETGDVHYFGQDVDIYKDGVIISHDGAWLAGAENAQPGLIMPTHFALGARYFQARAPGAAMDVAVNSAAGITMNVPAGAFAGCVRVTETRSLKPQDEPIEKTYAPGIGLVSHGDVSKLTTFTDPGGNTAGASPILSIQDAILLTWPLTDALFGLDGSSDLRNWILLPQRAMPIDGRNQVSVPRDKSQQYFRLSPIKR